MRREREEDEDEDNWGWWFVVWWWCRTSMRARSCARTSSCKRRGISFTAGGHWATTTVSILHVGWQERVSRIHLPSSGRCTYLLLIPQPLVTMQVPGGGLLGVAQLSGKPEESTEESTNATKAYASVVTLVR